MDQLEAIHARHSVREYLDKPIDAALVARLETGIAAANAEGDVRLQLNIEKPGAFSRVLARYGVFTNVQNYIAVVAKKDNAHEEAAGYYGQKIVLQAQQLGLNTCWVGSTYNKRRTVAKVGLGEKIYAVIALGYGENQGKKRKTKSLDELCLVKGGDMPTWFEGAMEAVQLAPTAMNQQPFFFTLADGIVVPQVYKSFYTHINFGIAKLHFEIGAACAGATESDWKWAHLKG